MVDGTDQTPVCGHCRKRSVAMSSHGSGPGSNTLRKRASRQVLVPASFTVLIIIIVTLAALLAVEKSKPPVGAAGPGCPDGWIGYRGKCYYFSETEGNWTYSQSQCSALSASLAGSTVSRKRISCCAIRASSTVGSASRGSQASPGRGPTAPNSTTGFR
nr:C-type lectin domain family 2 member F-like [Chrysemys picta bellii]